MILKKLQLKNFKQYGNLELDFREGLIGIVGKNGSGKSSLFEGVLLCLFGTISLDKNHYRSSWAGQKEAVQLELTFEVQGRDWRVVREYRGKALAPKAGLYNQHEEMVATDSRPVTEEIVKILGMDKDAFTRSVFSGQKELGIISNTKGEERKRMVRKMVGLDRLDDIQKLIREDRNTLSKEVQGQQKLLLNDEELQTIENQILTIGKESKVFEKEVEKLQKDFEKKTKKYQEAKKVFDEQSVLNKQFNTLNLDLEKWKTGIENFKEELVKNKNELTRLTDLEKELKTLQPKVNQFLEQRKEEEKLEKERLKFDAQKSIFEKQKFIKSQEGDIKTKISNLKKDFPKDSDLKKIGLEKKETLEKCISQQDIYEKQIADFQKQKGGIESRIQDRKSNVTKIEDLGKDATCPTCLQPLINSYDETLAKLQKEIEQYEKEELSKIQTQLDDSERALLQKREERKILEAELNELRNIFKEISENEKALLQNQEEQKEIEKELADFGKIKYDGDQHLHLKKTIAAFRETYFEFSVNEKEVAKKEQIQEHNNTLTERIKKGESKINDQLKAIKALKFSPEKFDGVQQTMDAFENEKEEAQQLWQGKNQDWQTLKSKLQGFQKELASHQKVEAQIAKNQSSFFQLDELNGIFQTFKTQILEKVRPSISYTASGLFQTITKGRYEGIQVDENFEFQILEDGQFFPITRFSGGEVDLANLCLRIGISRAIAELSGSEEGLSFLGFDEIFGSQDEERRYEILNALFHLKEQYRQIYIVSHVDSIKDQYPEVLEVRKTSDGSKVSWI